MYKLGSIESLVKSQSELITTLVETAKEQHADHEQRISTLEKKEARYATIASVIGFLAAGFVELLFKLWPNLH